MPGPVQPGIGTFISRGDGDDDGGDGDDDGDAWAARWRCQR